MADTFPELDKEMLARTLDMVAKWDFTLAKAKLLEPAYAGWNEARINAAERNYKRYISLVKALGGYRPVPNADIDRFWHEHILDTERYAQDCNEVFGTFLHHYPYFGMRDEKDDADWRAAADFSASVWESAFGDKLYALYSNAAKPQRDSKSMQLIIDDSTLNGGMEGSMAIEINITINVYGSKIEKTQDEQPQVILPDEERDDINIMKCPQKCPDRTPK